MPPFAPQIAGLLTAGLLSVALPSTVVAQTTTIVAPNADASTEGSGGNSFPFNIGSFEASERYQQVYLASQFSTLSPVGGLITQIAFRPDAVFGAAFSSTLPSVQFDLSTTAAAPSTLSSSFAANAGVNDTVVFGPGPLTLSSSFTGPAGGPKNFDIVINLSTPFFYNPALGNLLLDVRIPNFGGVTTTFFDFETSGAVGRAFTIDSGANSSTADPGDSPDSTGGLVTRFTFVAVPEPGSFALAALALGAGAMRVWLARGRRNPTS